MKSSLFILFLLYAAGFVSGKQTKELNSTEETARKSRNYDNFFSPENFGDDSASSEDSDKPVYSDAGPPSPDSSRWDAFPGYTKYKGYDKPTNIGQKSVQYYKGFPYYAPSWKGGLDDAEVPPATDDEMVEMMVMMNAMNKLQSISSKKEEKGLLTTLLSEPKYFLLAALIPVSIMLASFIPIAANYFTSGSGLPSVVTTLASSKLARAFDDAELMARILENIVEFGAKVLEDDECIQKVVCEVALDQGGYDNVKVVAGALRRYGSEGWLSRMGVEDIVKSLEKGDCKRLCSLSSSRGTDFKY